MLIKFIRNQSFENYSQDISASLNYTDETLQYLKISLEVYLKNLTLKNRIAFIKALPDFIEVDHQILKEKSGRGSIKSLRQLAELSIENSEGLISSKLLNSDKLLITIIVLFSVLQKYMSTEAIPILNTDIDDPKHRFDIFRKTN